MTQIVATITSHDKILRQLWCYVSINIGEGYYSLLIFIKNPEKSLCNNARIQSALPLTKHQKALNFADKCNNYADIWEKHKSDC